MSSKQVAS